MLPLDVEEDIICMPLYFLCPFAEGSEASILQTDDELTQPLRCQMASVIILQSTPSSLWGAQEGQRCEENDNRVSPNKKKTNHALESTSHVDCLV